MALLGRTPELSADFAAAIHFSHKNRSRHAPNIRTMYKVRLSAAPNAIVDRRSCSQLVA